MQLKNLIYILISIIFINLPLYLQANEQLSPNDQKIYNILQQAYIKESNLLYEFTYINKKFNYLDINDLLNKHQQNLNRLTAIMNDYSVEIPAINKSPSTIEVNNRQQVCKEGLLREKELASFYYDAVQTIGAMPPNETLGVLSELFNTLADNTDIEQSKYFNNCSK